MNGEKELLVRIKEKLPDLENLKAEIERYSGEDFIYRFYSQSYKVFYLQELTLEIVKLLQVIAPPGKEFCEYFKKILEEGANGKEFELEYNKNWLFHARPIVEAYFHAKSYLDMAIKYGKEIQEPPVPRPSGWAAPLE